MGLRTGALICQLTTSGVAFIMKEEGYSCVNYQDDFIGVELSTISEEAFLVLDNILHKLGLIEKKSKAVNPGTLIDCLGVLLNTKDLTMSITLERLVEINQSLSN